MTPHHRSLSALLATPALLAAAVLGAPAAAEPVFSAMQVELLPVGALPGDGLTPVRMHAMVLDTAGAPVPVGDVTLKVKGAEATLPEWIAPGLVRFELTAPKVDATTQVGLELRIKTEDKQKVKRSWGFAVEPPVGQRMRVTVDPPAVVARQPAEGEEAPSVVLSVELFGGAAADREHAELAFRASSGAVDQVTDVGDGRYTARYTPTPDAPPVPAVITVVDRRDPTRSYGSVVVPVSVATELEVKSRPKSAVSIDVAGTVSEPVTADRRGKAVVPVVLPPGVAEVTVISQLEEDETKEPLPLELAPVPLVELMGHYQDLPADGDLSVPVRLVAVQPDGAPQTTEPPALVAGIGVLEGLRHEGAGVWQTRWAPGAGNVDLPARLTAGPPPEEPVNDADPAPGPAQRALDIRLVPFRAGGLTVSTEPATLTPDTTQLTVTARVTADDGQPLPGRTIDLLPTGAKQQGAVVDNGDGTYTAVLDRKGRGPVEVLATAKAAATRNSVRDVVVLPTRQRLPPDGLSSTMLTILTLDEFGYPVADVPVAIDTIRGDGQVPSKATTGPDGVAQIFYTAGRGTTLVDLWVSAGGHATNVGLLQFPDGVAAGLSLPVSGPEERRALVEAWSAIVTPHHVEATK